MMFDRLGGRGDHHDQPPPGQGGAGGAGFMQQSPGTWHDLARMQPNRPGVGGTGGSSAYGGRRHDVGYDGEPVRKVWRPMLVF
jgi:hypothetical protein